MKFAVQLSAYHPDKAYGGAQVYADMLEQARLADRLGYDAVSITEHHLINILMNPAPLVFATRLAAETQSINIMTSVVVLPLHDMRTYAGEVIVTDMMTDGRLMLGVGRGAFAFEMDRLGSPLETSRDKFDESLAVLQALLSEEEVSWNGDYYQFDALTVMPRPRTPEGPQLMMAVMNPAGIEACTRRGFHIQTTPLAGNHQLLVDQVAAFQRGNADHAAGRQRSLSLSRVAFLCPNQTDRSEKLAQAHDYYSRFDNVYTGPGLVDAGMIRPLPRTQTVDELARSLLIEDAGEMVDQLGVYDELGIDRVILNMNFGATQSDTLENIQRFAEDVMPHFTERV
ncbi:MAG: LLM class flavin-dependent oxidoreductase [Pseudomonadota bacterium]